MHLEYQRLLQQYPGLPERLAALPGRLFSGKAHPASGTTSVFLCYSLPTPPPVTAESQEDPESWTTEGGNTAWYLYDVGTDAIMDEPVRIIDLIRCTPDTPRKHDVPEKTLSEIRAKIEKHIKNTYLRQVQAPIGVKPLLRAWMELS